MDPIEKARTRDDERRRGGRPAAGTDPHKRRQILEGAGRVFSSVGFDATSMSDIAREADVSKATLYVYFPNKERLFAAICAERRDRNIAELIDMLDRTRPIADVLQRFGAESLRRVSKPFVIAAQRIVIGVAERMPEIGQEFFEAGPTRLARELSHYLAFHAEAGTLAIEDPKLAAIQFLELSQASVFRQCLYGARSGVVDDAEINRIVDSAVRIFLRAHSPL